MTRGFLSALIGALFVLLFGRPAVAAGPAVTLAVDATQAPQKLYHVKEHIDGLAPGAFSFVYPKWIPGYHQPAGPIEAFVSLHVAAGGQAVAWRRDLVDLYEFHATLPSGATGVDIDFSVAGAESSNGQLEPTSTPELAVVEFSNFVVYPAGSHAVDVPVDARLQLPAGWTFGTALPVAVASGANVTFKRASLYTLIDSPVIAGAHEREYPLGPTEFLDVAADSAAGAEATPKFLTGLRHLVAEAPALYGGRHYRDYHFLLTASDAVPGEGIEHHESSDNRAVENYASHDDSYVLDADLLPHEYSHSWNGKYRRPGDLATADYQAPELTDLLWVYEGLNQYNGEKLATRAGLNDEREQLDEIAEGAASLDNEVGRRWRPLRDTADAAPFLYSAPGEYYNLRRSAGDFYGEGNLIWLDADVTIRRLTGGTKSLDDFCRLWGNGSDTTSIPVFKPYDRSDVIALLQSVVPYDWPGFFAARIDAITPHAPLGGIEGGGYKLVYSATPSALEEKRDEDRHIVDARYSIGLSISTKENARVRDVLTGSPAFASGVAPGDVIIAVDGRKFSTEVFGEALREHARTTTPLVLIYSRDEFVRVASIDAHTGPRYPHLERVAGKPDVLKLIFSPKTY